MVNQIKRKIIVSEFYFYGATGQLIYDLSLSLSKKNKIYILTHKTPKKVLGSNSNNLKLIKKGIFPHKNPKNILLKVFKGIFFLIECCVWIILKSKKGDQILLVSNPPFIGILGIISKLKGCNYFLLIQDLFPLSASIAGLMKKESFIFRTINFLIKIIVKNSSKTIVLSDDLKKEILYKYKPRGEVSVIHNWAVENIKPIPKSRNPFIKKLDLNEKFIIQYSGNFGRMHDITTIS